MSVDRNGPKAESAELIGDMLECWAVSDWQQWFWEVVSEGSKSRAEPCTQNNR